MQVVKMSQNFATTKMDLYEVIKEIQLNSVAPEPN